MKNNILLVLIFLSGGVFGAALTGAYMKAHTPPLHATCAVRDTATDLLLTQLEDAALPANVTDPKQDPKPLRSMEQTPSQLVRMDWPEELVMGPAAQQSGEKDKPASIVLENVQHAVVLNDQRPPRRAEAESNITMIEAPVSAKRISSLEQYKAFKRVARGSYPTVDFAKEEVVVLESQSNLPDKVFEIVEIIPQQDQVKVMYRVNVFGLDQKTNTHSAQKMPKTKLPVVLEQVL